jgi:hypothetical protein
MRALTAAAALLRSRALHARRATRTQARAAHRPGSGKQQASREALHVPATRAWEARLAELNADLGTALR